MSTPKSAPANPQSAIPQWQQLSGLTPGREAELDDDARADAIRKLLAEVDRLARVEFDRSNRVPPGERTFLWDPLQRVCGILGISRTKLSAFARELTGMRAYELTDRIKAATLKQDLRAHLEERLKNLFGDYAHFLEPHPLAPRTPRAFRDHEFKCCKNFMGLIRIELGRSGRVRLAIKLGYANYSRLSRACQLAHQISLDQMIETLVYNIVQKFLRAQHDTQSQPSTVTSRDREGPPQNPALPVAPSSTKEAPPPRKEAPPKSKDAA